jgi:hypothetical protein
MLAKESSFAATGRTTSKQVRATQFTSFTQSKQRKRKGSPFIVKSNVKAMFFSGATVLSVNSI